MFASAQDGIVSEVWRSVGLVSRDETNERLLRHRLQRIIEAPLISKRRNGVGGKLLAAKGSCAMRRVNQRFVGKFRQFFTDGDVKMTADIVGCPTQRIPPGRAHLYASVREKLAARSHL